ncbi:MAG: DUF2058 family protein [Pseudomonadota bacterium]
MAESLREQLVKAGLATRERADRLEQPKRHKSKKQAQSKAKRRGGKRPDGRNAQRKPGTGGKARGAQAKAHPRTVADDPALAEKRRIKSEIKALIEAASVADFVGELSFNFLIGERIRQIFLTEAAHKSVVSGELAITRLNRETHLIPPDVAERVKALNPNWLIVHNGEASGDAAPPADPDDPYTAYTVPDDLHW